MLSLCVRALFSTGEERVRGPGSALMRSVIIVAHCCLPMPGLSFVDDALERRGAHLEVHSRIPAR